jgi:pimeloyl-ACP methyl ester carboxylesterase
MPTPSLLAPYTEREIKSITLSVAQKEAAEPDSETDDSTSEESGPVYHYIEEGEDSAPLVILLHGFPDNALVFDQTLKDLSGQGFRAVAPFLRGHYPNEPDPEENYSLHSIAEDMLKLAEAMAMEQEEFHLIGHDWGASIAFMMSQLEPSKVKKLISLAMPHHQAIKPEVQEIFRAENFIAFYPIKFSLDYTRNGNFAYLDYLFKYWSPNWEQPEDHKKMIKDILAEEGYLEAAFGYFQSFFQDEQNQELHSMLQAPVTVPSQIIAGDTDGAIEAKIYQATTPFFSGELQLEILPGVGRFPLHEAPDLVNSKMLAFLGPAVVQEEGS